MNLPIQAGLPIHLLAACFNHTAATYKFYWFLSILHQVELGTTVIQKRDLFAGMVAQAWYTVNYFHVSFGKQDQLQQAIERIKLKEGISIDTDRSKVFALLSSTENKSTSKELDHFDKQVPHRFLSPWFAASNPKVVQEYSQSYANDCIYALYDNSIQINPRWVTYLTSNIRLLKDFCYWNLTIYLQVKNPNVPDLSGKLTKSAVRKSLTAHRKKFWDIVLDELGGVDCIYTNTRLTVNNYALEHFLPYAFVSHDLIWNLIPANSSFNSKKSDKLPYLDRYFEPFFHLQQSAIEIIQHKLPKNKFLEDYLTLFPSITKAYFTKEKFYEQLQPLVTIAQNNGFQYL